MTPVDRLTLQRQLSARRGRLAWAVCRHAFVLIGCLRVSTANKKQRPALAENNTAPIRSLADCRGAARFRFRFRFNRLEERDGAPVP